MEDEYSYKSRPSSSSAVRFLQRPVVSESIPLELEESDVVWSTTASDLSDSSPTEHSPAPNSPSNLPRHNFRLEKLGLSAAFSDDHASLLQRKPFLNPSLSAATAARTVPPVPLPRSESNSEDVSRSAPVAVPVRLKGRRSPGLGFRNDCGDGGEESEDEMVPPHEIVARSHATSFSVFEGVGRTLKGRDMRRVRDAVWQKTDMEGTSGVGEKSSRTNLKWNLNQDNYFISLMVAQHQMGRFMNGGFTSEGWNLISNDMIKTYGKEFTKDKLKHRLKSLKKNYGIVKKILEQSGFGWDDAEKKVNADDMVWEDYIKSHPEAKIYRSKKLPDYMGFAEVFGDALADGREAMSAFDPIEENVHLDSPIETQMDYEIDEGVNMNTNTTNTTNASNHRSAMSSGESSRPAKRMRPTVGNSLMNSLNAMTSVFTDFASKALQPQPPYEPPSQLARCVAALKELELPKKTYFKAFNFLRDSDRQAEAFLAHGKDETDDVIS